MINPGYTPEQRNIYYGGIAQSCALDYALGFIEEPFEDMVKSLERTLADNPGYLTRAVEKIKPELSDNEVVRKRLHYLSRFAGGLATVQARELSYTGSISAPHIPILTERHSIMSPASSLG